MPFFFVIIHVYNLTHRLHYVVNQDFEINIGYVLYVGKYKLFINKKLYCRCYCCLDIITNLNVFFRSIV